MSAHSIASTLQRLRHLVFGYDFFISYSQSDGKDYAVRLQRALAGLDFAVFRDETEISGGAKLTLVIRWAIRRTRCVLVLVTRGGLTSRWVADEIGFFGKRRRRVVPIDIHGVRLQQSWFKQDEEILFVAEPEGDLGPSEQVIREITAGRSRWRVQRLARWSLGMVVVLLLGLTVAALYQRNEAITNERTANKNFRTARARELAAGSTVSLESAPQRAVLLALEAVTATRADGNTDPEADRALRRSIASIGGAPIGRGGPIVALDDHAVSWDGKAVVWWSLKGQPQQEARVAVPGLGADDEEVSLFVLPGDRVLAHAYSRVVAVERNGVTTELLPEGLSNQEMTVLGNGSTVFIRGCRGCTDFRREMEKRGALSADEIGKYPDGDYATTAWTFSPQPTARRVANDPFGYGPLKAECADLLVVPESHGNLSLRRWTGEELAIVAEPAHEEGAISAWAISPGCKYWITGSSRGTLRVWRTDSKAASINARAHPSGITMLGLPGGNHLVIGQADGTVDVRTFDGARVGNVVQSAKHGTSVTGFAASLDNMRFATWARGTTPDSVLGAIPLSDAFVTNPYVWELNGGKFAVRLVPEAWTRRVEFAPDSRWLSVESDAEGGASKPHVRLWRLPETGAPRLIQSIEDADRSRFVGAGLALLVTQTTGTLRRLALGAESIKEDTALRWHESPIRSFIESRDASRIVSIDGKGGAALWRFDGAGALIHPSTSHVTFRHPDGAIRSAFAANDGRWMAALGDLQVAITVREAGARFVTSTVGAAGTAERLTERAVQLAADPAGNRIAVALRVDRTTKIEVLDVSRGGTPNRHTLAEQSEAIDRMGVIGSGRWLWTRLRDEGNCPGPSDAHTSCPRERFWRLDLPGPRPAERELSAPGFFIDDRAGRVLTSDTPTSAAQMLTFDGPQVTSLELPEARLRQGAGADPTGAWVFAYGAPEERRLVVGLIRVSNPSRLLQIGGNDRGSPIYSARWAQNGSRLALTYFDRTAVIDTSGSAPVLMEELPNTGLPLFAPDGSWVVISDGTCFARLVRGARPHCTTLSRSKYIEVGGDGTWFVASYEGGVVRFWNTRTEVPSARVISEFGSATTPLVRAAGALMAIAGERRLEVWRVADGEPSRLWEETLAAPVDRLTVTPGGVVWATTTDGSFHLWPAEPSDLRSTARLVLGRGFSNEERDRWKIGDALPGPEAWWR